MARSLTIVLPLPRPALMPNSRCHWRAKNTAAARSRRDAFLAARLAMGETWGDPGDYAVVEITYYHKQTRRRDADNFIAVLKPTFDGLVDAGVLLDDHHLAPLPPRFEKDPEDPRLVLRVNDATCETYLAAFHRRMAFREAILNDCPTPDEIDAMMAELRAEKLRRIREG